MIAAYLILEVTHAANGAAASDARFAFYFTLTKNFVKYILHYTAAEFLLSSFNVQNKKVKYLEKCSNNISTSLL